MSDANCVGNLETHVKTDVHSATAGTCAQQTSATTGASVRFLIRLDNNIILSKKFRQSSGEARDIQQAAAGSLGTEAARTEAVRTGAVDIAAAGLNKAVGRIEGHKTEEVAQERSIPGKRAVSDGDRMRTDSQCIRSCLTAEEHPREIEIGLDRQDSLWLVVVGRLSMMFRVSEATAVQRVAHKTPAQTLCRKWTRLIEFKHKLSRRGSDRVAKRYNRYNRSTVQYKSARLHPVYFVKGNLESKYSVA